VHLSAFHIDRAFARCRQLQSSSEMKGGPRVFG
jgi:hypothetical protein